MNTDKYPIFRLSFTALTKKTAKSADFIKWDFLDSGGFRNSQLWE